MRRSEVAGACKRLIGRRSIAAPRVTNLPSKRIRPTRLGSRISCFSNRSMQAHRSVLRAAILRINDEPNRTRRENRPRVREWREFRWYSKSKSTVSSSFIPRTISDRRLKSASVASSQLAATEPRIQNPSKSRLVRRCSSHTSRRETSSERECCRDVRLDFDLTPTGKPAFAIDRSNGVPGADWAFKSKARTPSVTQRCSAACQSVVSPNSPRSAHR